MPICLYTVNIMGHEVMNEDRDVFSNEILEKYQLRDILQIHRSHTVVGFVLETGEIVDWYEKLM